MRPSPTRDLVVGLFVLAGILALAWLSLRVGGVSYAGPGGLEVTALFNDIGGLKRRAPVVIAGVKVGQVAAIDLDDTLRARVRLDLDPRLALPEDTFASIRTAGLLGDQFIELEPGGSDVLLASGDQIAITYDALSLESLVDRFVTGVDEDGGEALP